MGVKMRGSNPGNERMAHVNVDAQVGKERGSEPLCNVY